MVRSAFIFPYQLKRIREGIIADPRIDLQIKTVAGFATTIFLLDSGADVTTLPINRFAKSLRFAPSPKTRITIGGVEGKGIGAFPYTLSAKLGNKEFKLRCYLIESSVDPLLGRLDFWTRFSIVFDNKKQQTIISSLS